MHCTFSIYQTHSAAVLRNAVFNELKKMKDAKTGFVGAAGKIQIIRVIS